MNQVMNRGWSGRAAACVGLLATAAAVHGQGHVFHVDNNAIGEGNGTNWANAISSLTLALQRARLLQEESGIPVHLKVAQGTYVPWLHGRSSTFLLLSGMTLQGGFAGIGAADPDENDPGRFVTVLSGDRFQDDLPNFENRSDNVFHVVTIGESNLEPALVGVTIRGGHADGEGVYGRGGGVRVAHPRAFFAAVHCRITDNFAHEGGGFATLPMASGVTAFINTTFDSNRAGTGGGGAWFSQAYFENCKFVSNHAGDRGGACVSTVRATLAGCALWGNTAQGGAGLHASGGHVSLHACTLANSAAGIGHDLNLAGGITAIVKGCILAGSAPHVALWDGGTLTSISNLAAETVSPLLLSATSVFVDMGSIVGSPRFADPLGLDGIAGTLDDDLRLLSNSPAIDAGLFEAPWFEGQTNLDAAGAMRVHDDLGMPNIGTGAGGAMDIGAYEFQGTSCRADHDGDGVTDDADIIAYLVDWFAGRAEADFDRDREHEVADIYGFLTEWFARCP